MAHWDYERAGSVSGFVEFLKEARDLSDQWYKSPFGHRSTNNKLIMGCILTSERARDACKDSRENKRSLKTDSTEQMEGTKLLLIGAEGSGKSTYVRRLRINYESGFKENEYIQFKPIIYNNIIEAMFTILQAMNRMDIPFDNPERHNDARLVTEAIKRKKEENVLFPDELREAFNRLWNDSGVLQCYERANEYELIDNMKHFFDEMDRIAAKDYSPTDGDILKTRVKTTGIITRNLYVSNFHLRLIEVNGQRSEFLRWNESFENASAVHFFTAISEYDQFVGVYEKKNRLQKSIELFHSIWNKRWLGDIPMVLFLNKADIFEEKITRSPFEKYFPQYKGSNDINDIIAFIRAQFEMCRKDSQRAFYCHVVSVTEETDMKLIYHSVANDILAQNLESYELY